MVLVVLVISACKLPSPGATQTPSPTTHVELLWTDCSNGFQCATLQVPLDYSRLEGRQISLALIRKPVTDPSRRIGSLLLNPGGPGGSGVRFLRGFAAFLKNLNSRFDLVSWDPRGVGASTAVTCLDGPQLDAFLALDSVLDDQQEADAFFKANQEFAIGCRHRSGDLLPFMDSESTARDMESIRAALGDSRLTYLGFSYGTFIGQWYAHLFPTRVRALALDGVVDSKVTGRSAALTQLTGFETNLAAYLADCTTRTTCTLARAGDARVKLVAVMNRLDATPLPVGNRQLTRSLAMMAVLATMYDQLRWKDLDRALTALDGGDGKKMLAIADYWNERSPDGTYSNFANGAFAATACLESPPAPSEVLSPDPAGGQILRASPFFGPWEEWDGVYCDFWPELPRAYRPLTISGVPPILVVGASNDPATPYVWSKNVSEQIPGSVLLTRIGNGHTSYEFSDCITADEDAYLTNLVLPAQGTTCTS
jgi:pimeloyl-ACP methyl ester carboxylesterase